MKIKSDGKIMLRFWLGLSELFAWLIIYQFLMYIGTLGIFICLGVLLLKWYALIADKRDVYHKYKRHRKASVSLLVCLTVAALALNIGSSARCFYALMLFLGFYLTNTYGLNLYEWVVRWGDLADVDREKLPYVYVQLSNTPEMLERENRKFLGWRFLPASFGVGLAAFLLWISPLFDWIRGSLMNLFAHAMLGVSRVVIGWFPDFRAFDPNGSGDSPVVKPTKQAFTEGLTVANTFETTYAIASYLLTAILLGSLAFFAYRVWRRMKMKALGGDFKSVKGKLGIVDRLEVAAVDLLSNGRKQSHRQLPSEQLRRKYVGLLKRLEKQGVAVVKTDTATQIRDKLILLYPGQEAAVDLITEAYCVRRYAERDPENIDEVLQAFDMLEGMKRKDSRIEGGVS